MLERAAKFHQKRFKTLNNLFEIWRRNFENSYKMFIKCLDESIDQNCYTLTL